MATKFNQASSYDKISAVVSDDGLRLFQLLSPSKGSRVLDFGCGTGNLTKVLADLVGAEGKVVGVDPDVERIKVAREKYTASNLEYVEGSSESIPGKNYDIIFSNHVLHWCKDKEVVFKDIAKVLRKGGKFGLSALSTKANLSISFFTPSEMFSPDFINTYLNMFYLVSLDEIKDLASKYNFDITYVSDYVFEERFDSIQCLIEYYLVHTKGIFDQAHFNIDAMKNYYGDGDIVIKYDMVTVILYKL